MALESDAFFCRLRIYALAIRATGNLLAVVPRRPLLFFLGLVHKLEEADDLQASQTLDSEFVSPAIQFAWRDETQKGLQQTCFAAALSRLELPTCVWSDLFSIFRVRKRRSTNTLLLYLR